MDRATLTRPRSVVRSCTGGTNVTDRICTVGSCERTVFSRDWCRMHYARWQRHDDPEKTLNHDRTINRPESSVSDSSRVEIDASRDLATIRLRTATGHLYDFDVASLASALGRAPSAFTDKDGLTSDHGMIQVRKVPTWEGVPIPDELRAGGGRDVADAIDWWKRGVTDANNAHLEEPS